MSDYRQPAPVLPPPGGFFRYVVESLLLLAVAVVLFRGFFAEGYMISTGSMAPTLLGYHRRVVCPDCRFEFARGAAEEAADENRQLVRGNYDIGLEHPALIRCPSCSLVDIPFEQLPRTEGDQLLVHKHAYEFRDPRRWEVIVFRNPDDPRQAYVKRVAGLPGEEIEIRGGEVFANGVLCRKPLLLQRAVKVLVSRYENLTPGIDPDAQPEWIPLSSETQWRHENGQLTFSGKESDSSAPVDWISYRHWMRAGGNHVTRVPLSHWPREFREPDPSISPLQFKDGHLQCQGVFSNVERQSWLTATDDAEFHSALNRLYEQAHLSGVTDESGYNTPESTRERFVDEFFLELVLQNISGTGRFEMRLRESRHQFTAVLDFGQRECRILRDHIPTPVLRVALPADLPAKELAVEFSLVDNQVSLALNHQELFAPIPYESTEEPAAISEPAQFGATGLTCQVSNVALSRDLHYVSRHDQRAGSVKLPEDEFFVLGDNSPVSVDSRVWEDPGVPRRALIGKPLVVHLPSKSQRITWKGTIQDWRLPDFSRVRVVR